MLTVGDTAAMIAAMIEAYIDLMRSIRQATGFQKRRSGQESFD